MTKERKIKTMNKYFVKAEVVCPKCKGTRWLRHPAWKALDFLCDADPHDLPYRELEKFFAGEGYAYPPDEQLPCHECDGAGIIVKEVRLEDALKDLNSRDRMSDLRTTIPSLRWATSTEMSTVFLYESNAGHLTAVCRGFAYTGFEHIRDARFAEDAPMIQATDTVDWLVDVSPARDEDHHEDDYGLLIAAYTDELLVRDAPIGRAGALYLGLDLD
jgi:hypothetical protein